MAEERRDHAAQGPCRCAAVCWFWPGDWRGVTCAPFPGLAPDLSGDPWFTLFMQSMRAQLRTANHVGGGESLDVGGRASRRNEAGLLQYDLHGGWLSG